MANKPFVRCRLHVVTTLNLFAQYSVKTVLLSSKNKEQKKQQSESLNLFFRQRQKANGDSSGSLVISETLIVGRRCRRTRSGNGPVGRSTRTRGLFPTGTSTTASTNTTLTSVSITCFKQGESCNRFKMQMKPQLVELYKPSALSNV